ncbi:hypothetical protein VTN02DRAFT_5663 [Thermoascus thermophilus]
MPSKEIDCRFRHVQRFATPDGLYCVAWEDFTSCPGCCDKMKYISTWPSLQCHSDAYKTLFTTTHPD